VLNIGTILCTFTYVFLLISVSLSVNPLHQKCLVIVIIGLILTQCGQKNSSQAHVQEGIEHSNQGHYDKAKESFLKAVEEDPNNLAGHYGLGGIYNLEKQHIAAEKAFKSTIQLDPTHFNAWYSLGYTYELMGKTKDAEKSYTKYRRLKEKMDFIMNKDKH
jgi:Tfp pilus assembly protein PilF